MPETYIPRSLEPVVDRAVHQFPVVVLVGPRQSGKTTLLQTPVWDTIPHHLPGAAGRPRCRRQRSARVSGALSSAHHLR